MSDEKRPRIGETRFEVRYAPRAPIVAEAVKRGYVEGGAASVFDFVDVSAMEVVDSLHAAFAPALARAVEIIKSDADFYGENSIDKRVYTMMVPEDGYADWDTIVTYNVDETGVMECIVADEYGDDTGCD